MHTCTYVPLIASIRFVLCAEKQLIFKVLLSRVFPHTHTHTHTHILSLSLPLSLSLSLSLPLSLSLSLSLFLPLNASQHRDPDKLQTTSNEAYNVVRGRACSGRVEEVVYETPKFLPLPTSSQPATAAGDYEFI